MRTATLSEKDLESFCKAQNLPWALITLEQLNSAPESAPKACFVFTGNQSDSINKGYHHHWLFLYGNLLFDSYSYQHEYTVPSESIQAVTLHPRILEEYGSNTCGEYCAAFYWFVSKTQVPLDDSVGQAFCHYFGFSSDRRENDKKIVQWFNSVPTGTSQVAPAEIEK